MLKITFRHDPMLEQKCVIFLRILGVSPQVIASSLKGPAIAAPKACGFLVDYSSVL